MSDRSFQASLGQECTQVWNRTCYGIRGECKTACNMITVMCMPAHVRVQLGPWLAVEIPDLIQKGLIEHRKIESK